MHLKLKVTPALVRTLIEASVPVGWHVHYSRSKRIGYCINALHQIHCPHPRNGYVALWTFFHEQGHALRFISGKWSVTPQQRKAHKRNSSSYEELCAEEHAIDMLAHFGFPATATEMLVSRENVRDHIRREDGAGLTVYEGARRFARGR